MIIPINTSLQSYNQYTACERHLFQISASAKVWDFTWIIAHVYILVTKKQTFKTFAINSRF